MAKESAAGEPWAAQLSLLNQRVDLLAERLDLLKERMELGSAGLSRRASSVAEPLHELTARINELERRQTLRSEVGWTAPPVPRISMPSRSSVPTAVPRPVESMVTGPVVSGVLQDLSLTTLLGLFELERNTGVLQVEYEERRLELELDMGCAVRCHLDGQLVSAIAGVREALSWGSGTFSFNKAQVDPTDEEPMSVNAVLLAASRLDDEAAAG